MRKLLLLSALLISESFAAPLALDFTTPLIDFTNDTWSMGYEFDVLRPVTVSGLGFYDDLKNGLTETHDVGIFDSAGNLLISGTVTNSDPLVSWFRFTSVTPTVLGVATGYRIAAVTGSENFTWDPTGLVIDPRISFVQDRFVQSTTLVYPTGGPMGVTGWFGPNFMISTSPGVVPEPSTWMMAGMGVVGVIALRRFIRR